jgi:hypothetical protein
MFIVLEIQLTKEDDNLVNRLSLEVQFTKKRSGSHYPVFIGDPINKKVVRIPITDCH